MNIEKLVLQHLQQFKKYKVAILQNNTTTTNLETGIVKRLYNFEFYTNAIVCLTNQKRDFTYDTSYTVSSRNFTYGGFFDISTRMIILPYKPDFEIRQNDIVLFNNKKYFIKDLNVPVDNSSVFLIINTLEGEEAYDPIIQSLIASSWTGDVLHKVAMEELINKITYSIFDGTIPDNFMLWTCSGSNFASALFPLWHPNVSTLTNSGFLSSDYFSIGRRGGLSDNGDLTGTKYIDTNYSLDQIDNDNFHISFYGSDFTKASGDLISSTLIKIDESLNVTCDNISLTASSPIEQGFVLLNGSSLSDTKLYLNGVLDSSSTTVRINDFTGNLLLFNTCKPNINIVSIGPSLTSTQITNLYICLKNFNARLGRLQ